MDTNQAEIVKALRSIGASVLDLHTVGAGCPDLLIGWRGENYLLEVKTPGGKLTPQQVDFMRDWRGQSDVVVTVEDALEALEVI